MISKNKYDEIVTFFGQLKVIHGPEFVNATLHRHKKLALRIADYEKCRIIDLESNLDSKE